jgi:hypothetical protein
MIGAIQDGSNFVEAHWFGGFRDEHTYRGVSKYLSHSAGSLADIRRKT